MRNEIIYKGKLNPFVWHLSATRNRFSIFENGLLPRAFENSAWNRFPGLYYPPAVFVNNHDCYEDWFYMDESRWQKSLRYAWDVWRIDTSLLNTEWYIDQNTGAGQNSLFTKQVIPKSALKLFRFNMIGCIYCQTVICNMGLDEALHPYGTPNCKPFRYMHEACFKEQEEGFQYPEIVPGKKMRINNCGTSFWTVDADLLLRP